MEKMEIVTALCSGMCDITYTKKNGQFRSATASLCQRLLPSKAFHAQKMTLEEADNHQKGRSQESNIVIYWDFNSDGWRSFDSSLPFTLKELKKYTL